MLRTIQLKDEPSVKDLLEALSKVENKDAVVKIEVGKQPQWTNFLSHIETTNESVYLISE
ncbi:MAG: hypothetical protein V4506_14500 [Bacteroidota bacterium]